MLNRRATIHPHEYRERTERKRSAVNLKAAVHASIAVALASTGLAIGAAPALAATTNLAPTQTITRAGSPSQSVTSVAVSPTGQVVTLDWQNHRIDVFAPDADGSSVPVQTIAGANTGLDGIAYLAHVAVDLVFAGDATGDTPPLRTIDSEMGWPEGIAVDTDFNVYVGMDSTPNSSIAVFGPDQSGPSTPIRTIGEAYGHTDTEFLAVDLDGNLYVEHEYHAGDSSYSVYEFGPDATAMSPPIRTINTTEESWGLTVDSAGNLYIGFTEGVNSAIAIYDTQAHGLNPTPLQKIQGDNTTMNNIGALAWRCDGTVFVTNYGGGDYLGFKTDFTGPAPDVASVSPSSGEPQGGTKIELQGTGGSRRTRPSPSEESLVRTSGS